jgi:hypothetical protein
MLKHIGFIVGMVIVALLVFFGLMSFEDQYLESIVTTGPDITLDEWRASFQIWAQFGIGMALASALLWFALGQWWFKMNDWTSTNNKRTIWLALGVVAILAAVPGVILTPTAQEGGRWAWPFYLVNNLIVFYVSTLLLSPSSCKYTPWTAAALRRWW